MRTFSKGSHTHKNNAKDNTILAQKYPVIIFQCNM